MDEENRDQPIVLSIEEEDKARGILRKNLQKDCCHLLPATDETKALDRVKG